MASNNSILAMILDPGARGQALRKQIREACKEDGNPLTTQAIFAWGGLKAGIPPRRVGIVAKILGKNEWDIRPDIFQPPRRRR